MSDHSFTSRRFFLRDSGLLIGSAALLGSRQAAAVIASDQERPVLAQGVQTGDVLQNRAIVWSRSDRPARMLIEWDTTDRFTSPRRLRGPHALEATDFTTRVDLTGLPAGQHIFYRVQYQSLANERVLSAPVTGRFFTPSRTQEQLRFVWSGDTAGQGYGINPEWGGMKIYEAMRQRSPQFFLHCGDTIYADGPLPAEKTVEGGKIWKNVVTEAKSKVAETLAEFRGNYLYNLLDDNVRRFNAEVSQIWQWDDHEVVNNWSDAKDLSQDDRYREKNVSLLTARASQAFREYAPLRSFGDEERERIYRHLPCGSLLDVFVVDMRSYRGPNSHNLQPAPSDETAFLGSAQIAWLKEGLSRSRATWKVVAADMPIGLHVPDGKDAEGRSRWEALANGHDGPPLGRELEIADLLRFIKRQGIKNVVWLTADVHYTAAHYYDPTQARFTDFTPFWEFVSGPLNAGSFGPNKLDATFGPQVVFQKGPAEQNTSPLAGLQFFGEVNIDAKRKYFTVTLRDVAGNVLFTKELAPA